MKRAVNGVIEKDRLRKSFSKKKITLEQSKEAAPPSPRQQRSLIVEYQVPLLKEVMISFERDIIRPISFHEDVFKTANLPKCLQHNNILTLYCKNDSKPLCAGCLYASQAHKPHKVVPLAKAGPEIKDSLSEQLIIAKKNLHYVEQLIKKTEENLVKTQQEYPGMIEKLHQFYLEMHERLVERKNEQIETMAQNWARLRYTYSRTKVELEKVVAFIKRHLESINEKASKDTVLYHRNVTLELAKVKNILLPQLGKGEDNRFLKDIENFAEIRAVIDKHLVFTNVYSLEKELEQIKKITKKNSSNPQTPTKANTKTQSNNFFQKVSPTTPKAATQQDHLNTESPRPLERTLSKNRHSKSDLLKKQKVEEKLRLKQNSQLKRKNNELHQHIMQKSKKDLFKKELSKVSPPKRVNSKNKSFH